MDLNKCIWHKSNKYYICILVTLALCYGFTLSHFSIGVDDELFHMYFYEGGLVTQKRWIQPFLAQYFDVFEFLPFWRDFLALIITVLALHFIFNALNDCARGEFDENGEIIFICLALSCTFIAYRFIFAMTALSVAGIVICQALIVRTIYYYTSNRNTKNALLLISSFIISRIMSESAIISGVTTAGIALTIILLYSKEKITFIQILQDVFFVLVSVVLAMGIYSLGTDLIYKELEINAVDYTSDYANTNLTNIIATLRLFPAWILSMAKQHATMKIYALVTIGFLVLGGINALGRKNGTVFIACACCAISPFFICVITCNLDLPLRVLANINLYIAMVALILHATLKKTTIKWNRYAVSLEKIMILFAVVVVINQSCEMNHIFFNDYMTYQRDVQRMELIYQDLLEVSDGSVEKPVCFVGIPSGYNLQDSGQGETWSIFVWDRATIDDLINHRIINFFNMHGLEIKQLTTYDENIIREQAQNMGTWPDNNAVCDFGEYYIVNLGP